MVSGQWTLKKCEVSDETFEASHEQCEASSIVKQYKQVQSKKTKINDMPKFMTKFIY